MGLRGPKPKGELDWYKPVAELMVNEFMSFSSACQALGLKFTNSVDEREHEYSPAFRNLLTGMHLDFFVDIGSNSGIGKEYVVGVAVAAIRKLAEGDQWEKVAIPLKQLSDVLGLTKGSEDRPVLANLHQSDIDAARALIKEQEEKEKTVQKVQVVLVDGKPN